MMLERKSLEQSMAFGLPFSQSWLRELMLIVAVDKTEQCDAHIDFTAIPLDDSNGQRGWLDPITTEGVQIGERHWMYTVYFNHDMTEVCNTLGGDESFDIRAHLLALDALHYELERTECQSIEDVASIHQAWLTQPYDDLLIPVTITLEAE